MMKRFYFTLIFALLLCFTNTQANDDSKGREFWLSFMPNFHNNVENPDPAKKYGDSLYIFINAEEPTSGKITYRDRFGLESVENFFISNPNELYTFKVSYYDYEIWGYNYHGNTWSNFQTEKPAPQYFHIETDKEVTVYSHTQAVTTSDAFLVLPIDAVGYEYYVMSYASDGRSILDPTSRTPSQFLIVATTDNTIIEIDTPVDTYSNPAGLRTITLNKGYSYLVQAKFDAGVRYPDLTGTHILADKPIAVFGGHQRSSIPVDDLNATSRDCLVEQIPSISTWGKNAFLIPPHEPKDINTHKGSLYRILACQNNTEIRVNGSLVNTLDKGDFFENVLSSPSELIASKPVLVGIFKYTAGTQGFISALGDPFMMLIPPKEQFIKKCKIINVQAWEKNLGNNKYYPVYVEQYITLVAPKSALDSVYIDNVKMEIKEFKKIASTDYYYAHIQVKPGIHDVVAKQPIGVYIYGYGSANSYGYTGGMGLKVINYDPPRFATKDSCFKTYGHIITSDTIKRYLVNVSEQTDSTVNAIVTIADYTNKFETDFAVELADNRYDGQAIISAKDNANKISLRRINIAGLTLSTPRHASVDTLPVYSINARPTGSISIPIENYGKFIKTISAATLTIGIDGSVTRFPNTINPSKTDSITVEFTLNDNNPKRDTLYITTKCGTRAIAAIYITSSKCDPSAFEFLKFYNQSELILNGKAALSHGVARLTEDMFYQVGTMWYRETVPVLDGFSTEFAFRFSQGKNYDCEDGSAQGADGIAFVIQNAGNAAIGFAGGSIGYEGIYNSLAIEFDTYSNDANQIENYFDPNGNHVAIQTMKTGKNTSEHIMQANLAMNDNILPILADSTVYFAKIVFSLKNKTLSVFLDTTDNPKNEVLHLDRFEIGKYLNLDRGYRAFVGFTAATGCAVEIHDILSWSFCPEFPNPDTNVEDNTTADNSNSSISVTPNPFNSQCDISFNMEHNGVVSLIIVDLLGYTVATLHKGILTNGRHHFNWSPSTLDRGVYFVRLNAGTQQIMEKIVFTY
jgi:hypothetical protein